MNQEHKIIKQLVLYDELNQKDIILNFDNGMNIIIGSKGGGKSTLLKILHAMHNKIKPEDKIIKTLKEYQLKIKEMVYSNNEKVNFDNLEKNPKLDLDDIISQEDKIKTALSDINEVKKDKQEFLERLIEVNAALFINLIKRYNETFINIANIRKKYPINWNYLAYFNSTTNEKLTELKHQLMKSFHNLKFDNTNLNLFVILSIYQEMLANKKPQLFNEYNQTIENLLNIHLNELKQDKTKQLVSNTYQQCLNDIKRQLQESNDIGVAVTNFKKNAQSFFEDLATQLAYNSVLFKHLNDPNLKIQFNAKTKTHYDMELSINETIYLNEVNAHQDVDDTWVFIILEKIFFKPKKKLVDWTNWLFTSYEKTSINKLDNDITKINKYVKDALSEKIENKVKLLAENKNYDDMSLGTRTSYGIKQKIKYFQSSILFLDQPEDNLDNYTIYHELINLFEQNKQFFMVTHNSNFGTLTKPKTITTCSLSKNLDNQAYQQATDLLEEILIPSEQDLKDSPIRHYLEGGINSLDQRYQALRKENK